MSEISDLFNETCSSYVFVSVGTAISVNVESWCFAFIDVSNSGVGI